MTKLDWDGVKTDKLDLNKVKQIGISKDSNGFITKLLTKKDDNLLIKLLKK